MAARKRRLAFQWFFMVASHPCGGYSLLFCCSAPFHMYPSVGIWSRSIPASSTYNSVRIFLSSWYKVLEFTPRNLVLRQPGRAPLCVTPDRKMTLSTAGVDPSARLIAPTGLPLAIIVISFIFLGLSLVAVSLRTYIRLRKRIFGLDDAFMAIGTVRLLWSSWIYDKLIRFRRSCTYLSSV